MPKNRKTFDASFKLEVAKMVKEQGLSISHVSQSMGMSQTAVRRWVSRAGFYTAKDKLLSPPIDRQFDPTAPNAAYVSDITYIRTGTG